MVALARLWGVGAMRRLVLIILLAAAAVACQALKPDPAAVAASRAVFDDLRLGRDAALLAKLPPQLQTPEATAQIDRLRTLLPPGDPRGSTIVGSSIVEIAGKGRSEALNTEYDYGNRIVLFKTRLFQPPGARDWRANGFYLQVATTRQLAVNSFTLAGKPLAQIAFLAFAVASPLLMIVALVRVIRTPGLKRKWLWGILAFVGLFTLQMNWTAGAVVVQWLSVQLIGFGVQSSPSHFDPWIVKATLPLGALLILAGLWANPVRKPSPASADSGPSPAQ